MSLGAGTSSSPGWFVRRNPSTAYPLPTAIREPPMASMRSGPPLPLRTTSTAGDAK